MGISGASSLQPTPDSLPGGVRAAPVAARRLSCDCEPNAPESVICHRAYEFRALRVATVVAEASALEWAARRQVMMRP